MSQRKLKLLRKENALENLKEVIKEEVLSWREILRANRWFLMVMCGLILILYVNGFWADFVSDDYATILNNPEIATWSYALQNGATTYFVNGLLAMISGVAPFQFHLLSVFIFIITCVLALILVNHLFGKQMAMITMLLFIVHPIHVEAVTWISGKPYLIIAMYVLLALLFFIKFIETEKLGYLVGTGAAFLMGFLTDNPRPFSLFLIIPLYLWLKRIDIRKNKWFRFWPYLLIPAIIVGVVAWPHILQRVMVVNAGVNTSDSIFYNPLFQYPTGWSKYLQLLWLPVDLTLYHTMYVFPNWLNWSIFLMYLTLVIYFGFKDRRYTFALLFMFAAIWPSMTPVKVSWLVAERYAYLGSLGFCLFLGLILNDLSQRWKWLSWALLSMFLVFYGVRTGLRNTDWQTNHKLWVNTCQVSPNSHNAWNNIGDDYDKLKQYDNSIKGFTQSTVVKNNYADAYHNRANIFFKIGRLDLARDSYMTALHFNPELYQTYLSLIQIDLIEKKLDWALEKAQIVIKMQSQNPQAAYVLAIVYSQRGENNKAQEILNRIVQVYPGYQPAVEALRQLKAIRK